MSELDNLISRLESGLANNTQFIKSIKHPKMLINSLKELNCITGNSRVKDSVAEQINHLIIVKRRILAGVEVKEDEVMMNTVLFGQPGTGKTMIGTKLAKIWYALGYIEGPKNIPTPDLTTRVRDFVGSNESNASGVLIVLLILLIILFLIYSSYGGQLAGLFLIFIVIFIIVVACCYNGTSASSTSEKVVNNTKPQLLTDDQLIKIVTRDDFVDKYVGWTANKTNALLRNNLGKVLFVDEAYSLLNGVHDEFGMEALTALNLFMSQHPREIIIIFAGYKDLLETGPFAVQPGLRRRFLWHFHCNGYNSTELFSIFKQQLNKKGWGLTDDSATLKIFNENYDAFPAYGGDTERAGFFAELEHSKEFVNDDSEMSISLLTPNHVLRGINKLRENNFDSVKSDTQNPLANLMKMVGKDNNSESEIIKNLRDRINANNFK